MLDFLYPIPIVGDVPTKTIMIISETVSSPIVTNIPSAPSRFKIKASAKAFKILSGFYSEPILAIPRELGANAWDSHVKKGNTDRMFEVHAPNSMEPWFSIRDFGTGLSAEDIDTIYTTYFESTKTGENDSDGCMGLGSKTPFNYTDNFNVTSWYNGRKHVYSCFIDETGSPNIVHIATEDSADHSGLEVKFGVKLSDISMWVDKITRAFEPFRFRPVIKGASIIYPEREYLYKGKNWALRKSANTYSHGCNAFMGNYCYPISSNALRTAIYKLGPVNSNLVESALNNGSFDFFFNIGDLEVAPNKEQLQYEDDNSTTRAIIHAAIDATKELKSMVMNSVEIPTTLWEAMELEDKYNSYGSVYYSLRNIIGNIPIKFNNKEVNSSRINVTTVHADAKLLSVNTSLPLFQLYAIDSPTGKLRRSSTYYAHKDRKVLFFYTNGGRIKIARFRHFIKSLSATNFPICYVITDLSPGAATFFAHKKHFGWADSIVMEIEALPKPPVVPRAKRTASTDEIWYAEIPATISATSYNNSAHYRWSRRAETIDSTKTYYYVDYFYNEAMWGDKKIKHQLDNILREFVSYKLNEGQTVVYGINKKNQNLLKVGKWVNIVAEVKKVVIKNKEKYEEAYHLENYYTQIHEHSSLYKIFFNYKGLISNFENKETKELFQSFMAVYNKAGKAESLEDFYSLFGITAKKHTDDPIDLDALKNVLNKKYMGIFDAFEEYCYDNTKVRTLANIINFIDKNS